MSVISYLIPQVVARFTSPQNHDIRVLEERGKYKLLVNGSRQSGEYVKELWQHAFSQFGIIPSPDVQSILVLGVAGGTAIHLVRAIYPDAKIEGVDIDPKMIDIGKKYFGLASMEKLTLLPDDANLFVERSATGKRRWDMVIIDIFIGPNIPPFVGEREFLQNLKKILTPRGAVVINYLREFEYEKLSLLLLRKLKTTFRYVRHTDIFFNRFFYSSNTSVS